MEDDDDIFSQFLGGRTKLERDPRKPKLNRGKVKETSRLVRLVCRGDFR